mmetsp:Transcript_1129/g.1371  ORF Transcript_1129/g.1371 Transcript_1129/m.1371 type:complete len:169 (-) Transcript_1129:85-591(-)
MPHDDFYSVLGVSTTANEEDIRKAYLKGALRWHPDKNPDSDQATDMFKRLARAYHVLSDKKLRSAYDRSGTADLDEDVSMDKAYQVFLSSGLFWFYQSPAGMSPIKGFSEAKLRELFPDMFGENAGEQAVAGQLRKDETGETMNDIGESGSAASSQMAGGAQCRRSRI